MLDIVSGFFVRISTTVVAAELLIVILMSPALLFPTPMRMLVLLVVPIVWLCARHVDGHLVPPTPLNAAIWLLLTMVAVSLYATFDVRFSLGKVSGVILGVLLFWAVTRWITTCERLSVGVAAFLLASGGLAIIGLLGTDWPGKLPMLGAVVRRLPKAIRGVPGAEGGFQPNAVAGCLVLFVPLQVAMVAGGWQRRVGSCRSTIDRGTWLTVVQALLLTLTAGTLLLTQSRGALVGLLVAALAFFFWHTRLTRALAISVAGGIALTASALGPARFFDLPARYAGRMELWSKALYGIRDFPFTGMGMNAFRKVMPVLYPTTLALPDVDVAHAHNHLLQAALDVGIPGLVAYSSIWIVVGVLLVAVYRRSTERTHRTIAGGLGAGLIAHFVFGMTDAISLGSKPGVLFWFMLALIVSLHRIALPPKADYSGKPALAASS